MRISGRIKVRFVGGVEVATSRGNVFMKKGRCVSWVLPVIPTRFRASVSSEQHSPQHTRTGWWEERHVCIVHTCVFFVVTCSSTVDNPHHSSPSQ